MQKLPSRRTFLGTTAGLAVLGSALRPVEGRKAPGQLRLGVATYSLRKFSRTDAIKILKQLKVKYVSIKSFHLPYDSPVPELRAGSQQFLDSGFEILSGGNIGLQKPSELRSMFQYAKQSGLPMMVCAPAPATLDAVENLVKEFDIRIAIHNHGPEDKNFPSPQSALVALEGRDPRMGLCIDVGHTTRTGADVVEWIRRAGPRLFDLHIKDLANLMDKKSQVDVGDGAMPVVAMFEQLKAMNYQGGVMLEYEINANDPLLGMARSISYMRGVLDGLAV